VWGANNVPSIQAVALEETYDNFWLVYWELPFPVEVVTVFLKGHFLSGE
jgi:hypothetical protein